MMSGKETNKRNEGVKTMSNVSYIISNSGNVNLIVGGKSHTIAVDHANYEEIIDRLKEENYEDIEALLDVASSISIASDGKVTVLEGCVCYDGREVINPLTDRILTFVKEGLPFKPMIRFLENLMENPSRTSIQELYLFLENATLPITEDGCFLAYKKVGDDYLDLYSHSIDNSVGEAPEVPRNSVDDVRDNLCSYGLHFCSLEYLPKYHGGSGRVMIVKIDPKDVVSIPSDYNNAKGRCCKYEVIGEHTDPEKEYKDYSESAVVQADGSEVNYEDETCVDCCELIDDCICADICPECGEENIDCECDQDNTPDENLGRKPDGTLFHNVRDAFGKFVKRS